jgi:hypothetical protein
MNRITKVKTKFRVAMKGNLAIMSGDVILAGQQG